jgi:hypothetical protein
MAATGSSAPPDGDSTEALVLEKVHLLTRVTDVIDRLFYAYLDLRTSDSFRDTVFPQMTGWIRNVQNN